MTGTSDEDDGRKEDSEHLSGPAITAGILLLCVAIVLRMFAAEDRPHLAGPAGFHPFISVLFVLALVFYCGGRWLKGAFRIPVSIPVLTVCVFFIWVVGTSAFAGIYGFGSLFGGFIWGGHFAGVLFLLLLYCNNRDYLLYPVGAALASGATLLLYGWYERLFYLPELRRNLAGEEGRLEEIISPELRDQFLLRLEGFQPSASLLNPNSYAALSCMIVLFLAGIFVSRWLHREPDERLGPWGLYASGLLLLVTAWLPVMLWTGSTGSLVALGLSTGFMGLLSFRRWLSTGVWWGVAGACVVVLFIAGTLSLWTGWGNWHDPGESTGVRKLYWESTLDMVRDRPLTGTGLYNYQFEYLSHRRPAGRETRRAHNDYLDLASETGVPGALLFVLLWGLASGSFVCRREEANRAGTGNDPPGTGMNPFGLDGKTLLAGPVALLFLHIPGVLPGARPGESLVLFFFLVVTWSFLYGGFLWLCPHPDRDLLEKRWGRILLGGAASFYLFHALVDFDLYAVQTGWFVWMILAFLLAGGSIQEKSIVVWKPSRTTGLVAGLGLFLLSLPILSTGSTLVETGIRWNRLRNEERTVDSVENRDRLKERYESLIRERDGDVELLSEVSSFLHRAYCRPALQSDGVTAEEATSHFEACLGYLEDSKEILPENWGVHRQLADHLADHRSDLREHERSGLRDQIPPAYYRREKIEGHLRNALEEYPNNAHLLYRLGTLLKDTGRSGEAKSLYRRALDIHDVQTQNRLKLETDKVEQIRTYLGE